MVNIEQLGPETRVVLTLNECLCGTDQVSWLFLLTNMVTGATVAFTAPDISQSPGRYNEFIWQSVGATAVDLQDGKFHLVDAGTYRYDVYQMPYSGCTGSIVLEGAGTTAVNGTYCPDGTFNGSPRWTKAGATSNEDSIYVATLSPQHLWVVTSGGSYAQNPLNVKYYNVYIDDNPGSTAWIQASGGDDPPPTYGNPLNPVDAVGLCETGTLILWADDAPLPSYSTPTVVIPTFDA